MRIPLVSVVIPVYNGSRYLREAIDSVLAQTYERVEVIAVDDGSTDDSPAILESYGDRIRVIRQQNQGVGAARNAGVVAAHGEFVGFLDQDDIWRPHKLIRQIEEIEKNPDIGLVHSEVEHFDEIQGRTIERFNEDRSDLLVGDCYEQLLLGNGIFNCSVLVRRNVIEEAGMFDTNICGNTVQDYDLWLRCARLTKFAYCSEELAVYRLHANQGMWNVKASLSQQLRMLERHIGPPERVKSFPLRCLLQRLFSELGIEHLDAGERMDANVCFRRSLRIKWSIRNTALYAVSFLPRPVIDFVRASRSRIRRMLGRTIESKLPAWTGRVNNGF